MNISIVVPLSLSESSQVDLLNNLSVLGFDGEVILVSPKDSQNIVSQQYSYKFSLIEMFAGNGRASQMNLGALNATHDLIWFLHADSILPSDALHKIENLRARNINAIYYFYLSFYSKSYIPIWLNSIGANLRSLIFKAPFGDQGLLMKKETFLNLGKYTEDLGYGEDNVLILTAKNAGIPILPIGATISTSARKYEENGWLKTSLIHQFLWIKQSLLTVYKGYE